MSLIATITPMDYDNPTIQNTKALRRYSTLALRNDLFHPSDKAPFHGDILYHQMFNYNSNPHERQLYHELPIAWQKYASVIHIYTDVGINHSMIEQVNKILSYNPDTPIEFLSLNSKNKKNNQEIGQDLFDQVSEEYFSGNKISLIKPLEQIEIINKENSIEHNFQPQTIGDIIRNPTQIKKVSEFIPVILESPFAGDIKENVFYTQTVINKLAQMGYAASASHLSLTLALNDFDPYERQLGINKGIDIAHDRDSVICLDRGISRGMIYGIERAIKENRKIIFLTLSDDPIIKAMVESLRDADDALKFCEMMKNKNKDLYESTGYLIKLNINSPRNNKQLKIN